MPIYTPEQSSMDKDEPGLNDLTIVDGVYKFMGCSLLSASMTLGYNSTASSVNVSFVEDTEGGDDFTPPGIPSLWAIGFPDGGVGAEILPEGDHTLHPDNFNPTNVPFYFAGICTDFKKSERNISGKTYTATIVDPRELLTGVQCLLGGFALSHEVGVGGRYLNVKNIMDIFGYYEYGAESERNEYGMEWSKIRDAISNLRVTIKDLNFEFVFTGDTFLDTPDWYRIDDEVIDLVSLCQRVAEDGGSDFIMVGRRVSSNEMLVEIRGIRRTNGNPLTQTEIAEFVAARNDIVENVNLGREFRNEPNSSVIVGGFRNSNYLALPSEYLADFHLGTDGKEDYSKFPSDIKVRLFGGTAEVVTSAMDAETITKGDVEFEVNSGAIFPFWGFTPDDHAYPLIEPFLSLDHLSFDTTSILYGELETRIPVCKIAVMDFPCRVVTHSKVFLDGDELTDDRPFAYLETYAVNSARLAGYVRGMPLNTEVLRASLVSQQAFYDIYSLYWPDIAEALGVPGPDWEGLQSHVSQQITDGKKIYLHQLDVKSFMTKPVYAIGPTIIFPRTGDGAVDKGQFAAIDDLKKRIAILERARTIIYELVRQYALDHMGRKFIVCLPRSEIMQRLWDELPVPTNPDRPEIEYVVDQVGYWEEVPAEFDGIENGQDGLNQGNIFTATEEEQIRRKFMAEDGRFYPMAVIDWKPMGNVNFNSNGINKAMFQDLPTSEFRPNKIASGNPEYVFVSCSASQLVKRPDLALVELPSAITFDPTLPGSVFEANDPGDVLDDEFIATKLGMMKYFWYFFTRNQFLKTLIKNSADDFGEGIKQHAVRVFTAWSKQVYSLKSEPFRHEMSTEIVMDLKGVIIPLTSTVASYGPYYYTYDDAKGMVNLQVDQSLVPWNFERPPADQPWYLNLDAAGFERLARTLCNIEYADTATISVAGFPEFGPASFFGYNSNITGISVDFGIGGIKTVYSMGTYSAKPGTYRKSEYDDVSRARIDSREKLPEVINENIVKSVFGPNDRNRFDR